MKLKNTYHLELYINKHFNNVRKATVKKLYDYIKDNFDDILKTGIINIEQIASESFIRSNSKRILNGCLSEIHTNKVLACVSEKTSQLSSLFTYFEELFKDPTKQFEYTELNVRELKNFNKQGLFNANIGNISLITQSFIPLAFRDLNNAIINPVFADQEKDTLINKKKIFYYNGKVLGKTIDIISLVPLSNNETVNAVFSFSFDFQLSNKNDIIKLFRNIKKNILFVVSKKF